MTVQSLFWVYYIIAGICNVTGANVSKFSQSQFKLFWAIMNLSKLYLIWKNLMLKFLKSLWWKIFGLPRHLKVVRNDPKETKTWTLLQFLEFIMKWDFYESVPNFLTMVYMLERNFSKLKVIKLWMIPGQIWLYHLLNTNTWRSVLTKSLKICRS